MKIRTDFVTNSSSSSYTIIHFSSALAEDWVQKHSVTYTSGVPQVYSSFDDLLSALATDIDTKERIVELTDEKGIIGNIIDAFGDVEDESLVELVRFLEENKEDIEAEGNGEFIYASQTEMEAPTIDAIRHQRGQATHDYLSLDEIEPDEEDIDIWDFASWDDEKIRRILEKYASEDE